MDSLLVSSFDGTDGWPLDMRTAERLSVVDEPANNSQEVILFHECLPAQAIITGT